MTTSLSAHYHLLHLRKKRKEMMTSQGGLPSSTTLEKKNKEMTTNQGGSPSSATTKKM